jgi:hypothetical protein
MILKNPPRITRTPSTIVDGSFVNIGRVKNIKNTPRPLLDNISGNQTIHFSGFLIYTIMIKAEKKNIHINQFTRSPLASPLLKDSASRRTVWVIRITVIIILIILIFLSSKTTEIFSNIML